MASSPTTPSPGGLLGPDPGQTIRVWVTLLLRLGIGLSLLSTGLTGYYRLPSAGGFGGGPWGSGSSLSMLDPFMSGLPYLAIGLGLALILGFLTTASAIGAGFLTLIIPFYSIIHTILAGSAPGMNIRGPWGNEEFLSMMLNGNLAGLLTNAAMIWLSPLENNPISVDALIFGRNEIAPIEAMPEPIPEIAPVAVEEPPMRIED